MAERAEGHKLRNLLLSEYTEPKPTLMGDAISDEQLAERVDELRSTIAAIGNDVDVRSWDEARATTKEAQIGLDDLILNLKLPQAIARAITAAQAGHGDLDKANAAAYAFYGFPGAVSVLSTPERIPAQCDSLNGLHAWSPADGTCGICGILAPSTPEPEQEQR